MLNDSLLKVGSKRFINNVSEINNDAAIWLIENKYQRINEKIFSCNTDAEILDRIMTWNDTPQGHSYWLEIHYHLRKK